MSAIIKRYKKEGEDLIEPETVVIRDPTATGISAKINDYRMANDEKKYTPWEIIDFQ